MKKGRYREPKPGPGSGAGRNLPVRNNAELEERSKMYSHSVADDPEVRDGKIEFNFEI